MSSVGAESTPPGYTFAAKGVYWDGDGIVRQKGRTSVNVAGTYLGGARITAAFDFQTPVGKQEIICGGGIISKIVNGTETQLVTGRTVNAIERGGVFMGNLILTNGFDPVLAITVGGGVSPLTAPVSKVGIAYNNHFFVANQPDGSNGPSVVQNSALRDFTTFDVLNAYNIESNNADVIRALFTLGGYLAIGKEDSISFLRGRFFDQTSASFDAYILPPYTGGGVLCPQVVNDRYGRAFYFNEGGFWLHSSVDQPPRLLSNNIRSDIKRINVGRADEMTIAHIPQLQEIWCNVPIGGKFETWRYVYRPDSLGKDKVGAWWFMPWTDLSAVWTTEVSLDISDPRGGSTGGKLYKMDQSWSDDGAAYETFCEFPNARGPGNMYQNWSWVLATMDNTGLDVTMECYPDDIRNDPLTLTLSPNEADNRLTAEEEVAISGNSRCMGLKIYNNSANNPWGVRELRFVCEPDSHVDGA